MSTDFISYGEWMKANHSQLLKDYREYLQARLETGDPELVFVMGWEEWTKSEWDIANLPED
jgi:hypothetical protein